MTSPAKTFRERIKDQLDSQKDAITSHKNAEMLSTLQEFAAAFDGDPVRVRVETTGGQQLNLHIYPFLIPDLGAITASFCLTETDGVWQVYGEEDRDLHGRDGLELFLLNLIRSKRFLGVSGDLESMAHNKSSFGAFLRKDSGARFNDLHIVMSRHDQEALADAEIGSQVELHPTLGNKNIPTTSDDYHFLYASGYRAKLIHAPQIPSKADCPDTPLDFITYLKSPLLVTKLGFDP